MSRPSKKRRICTVPSVRGLLPIGEELDSKSVVAMTIDEYETVRLIDLEGVTQEQCAERMNIARTTAQAIYGSARKKLAQCIVEGSQLIIEGGNYSLCEGDAGCKKKSGCKYKLNTELMQEYNADKEG